MLFNSFEFLLFLPIVFFLYWFVFHKKLTWQNIFILMASYVFYGWWSWKFLILLALSTVLDYSYGFGVASPDKKKAKLFLWLGILNNLGILAIFKYYNFFVEQIQDGLALWGVHFNPFILHIALPVGISFYTFHGMSYVFDIYRGVRKPVVNFVDYAVFVCFFPLLVAGPIERAGHLLPQVQRKRVFDYGQAMEGGRLILWGLFKKVVIADGLAETVDLIFGNYQQYDALTLLIGAVGFSFQIYSDFSGYSDIALGTARLFGFELLSNFRFPYFSRDIAEFWRRWHISLSSWFRDYLYIPLGGSRQGKRIAVRNTFIIFLVSGFWHGANWTFIVWGATHAFAFLPLLLLNRNRIYVSEVVAADRVLPTGRELFEMLSTFSFVTLAWIFFRAPTLRDAVGYFEQMAASVMHGAAGLERIAFPFSIAVYIPLLILFDWWNRHNERTVRLIRVNAVNWSVAIVMGVLVINNFMGYTLLDKPASFIYFNF